MAMADWNLFTFEDTFERTEHTFAAIQEPDLGDNAGNAETIPGC